MDELRFFFSAWMKPKNDKEIVGVEWRSGVELEKRWDENGISLTLPFLTFIMLKGHSEHPASSSPVVL